MPMKGVKKHTDRLKKLQSKQAVQLVGKALFAGGQDIVAEAQRSISAGSVSGAGHVASKPGEPPNYDTGVLSRNIEAAQTGPLKVTVGSYAEYASPLEFGTSRMSARPYMVPARDKRKAHVRDLVVRAVKQAVRKSGS